MSDRADLVAYLRGELVGPAVPFCTAKLATFVDGVFTDELARRAGGLCWRPDPEGREEEVLYYYREDPRRKYGAGMLHPAGDQRTPDADALVATDTVGVEGDEPHTDEGEDSDEDVASPDAGEESPSDDFEVTSPDVRRPSSLGLSFCALLPEGASIVITLPRERKFAWQDASELPCQVNGRYESCVRVTTDEGRPPRQDSIWRRSPAVPLGAAIQISAAECSNGRVIRRPVATGDNSQLRLTLEAYPRPLQGRTGAFLVTIVLRNTSEAAGTRGAATATTLFQVQMEVSAAGGVFAPYPESERPFDLLDADEQSLGLLYRDASTWAIGHGCAAGWDTEPGQTPQVLFTDVLPAVETPSMTPDITTERGPLRLRMRDLALLPDDGRGPSWDALEQICTEYEEWIRKRRAELPDLEKRYRAVAERHLAKCDGCLARIRSGIACLRGDATVCRAFCLANRAMLLQQIATKVTRQRPLAYDERTRCASPVGTFVSPHVTYGADVESEKIGVWRAFQIAFLLMQLSGMSGKSADERECIDLIWFPTGGGKTEAYLAVMAFYLFHLRLKASHGPQELRCDGTNALMRYTLRMLTTQQFQRAASLVSAMEFMRRNPGWDSCGPIAGGRFAVGLWIGRAGTPNSEDQARTAYLAYERGEGEGNPFVLTECPWCRAAIGGVPKRSGKKERAVAGIMPDGRLRCPDPSCPFGQRTQETWLPVEVVDSRIYETKPSLVIATADKFAMIAYRPDAGGIFGLDIPNGALARTHLPPGLIVQDELHLIAGPLGTMYGLYEGVIEALCSAVVDGVPLKPKIIASTATIRGADEQARALYARVAESGESNDHLFPSPGLTMGDSFFGRYARRPDGSLDQGRLYLGIHASDFGSVLTAQVRTFAAVLARTANLPASTEHRDPWWTLMAFYNSLRELGGAKTLFDSDIRSRLKFLQNRESVPLDERRRLRPAEELTSRLSQAEIVRMMDQLSVPYGVGAQAAVDACLASSIIEVGVDIDRLSLLGVVGQPKTTAQYIQVTGRVGRRWQERPGLVLMIYSPARSRDRSHFEQFYSYHRRLYERVEPTSATPFAPSAIARALSGALLVWARQIAPRSPRPFGADFAAPLREALDFFGATLSRGTASGRCASQLGGDADSVRTT